MLGEALMLGSELGTELGTELVFLDAFLAFLDNRLSSLTLFLLLEGYTNRGSIISSSIAPDAAKHKEGRRRRRWTIVETVIVTKSLMKVRKRERERERVKIPECGFGDFVGILVDWRRFPNRNPIN